MGDDRGKVDIVLPVDERRRTHTHTHTTIKRQGHNVKGCKLSVDIESKPVCMC